MTGNMSLWRQKSRTTHYVEIKLRIGTLALLGIMQVIKIALVNSVIRATQVNKTTCLQVTTAHGATVQKAFEQNCCQHKKMTIHDGEITQRKQM